MSVAATSSSICARTEAAVPAYIHPVASASSGVGG